MTFIDRFFMVERIGFVLAAFQIGKQAVRHLHIDWLGFPSTPIRNPLLSINNLFGDIHLTAHRIDGHDTS